MIAIRLAGIEDMPLCAALPAVYITSTIWRLNPDEWTHASASMAPAAPGTPAPLLGFHLQQVRLPRQRTLKLPSAIIPLADAWTSYNARLVALVDDVLCGYVCIQTLLDQQQGIIARLLVDTRMRRKGVGRTLVRAAAAWANGQGLAALTAHAPLRNAPGIEFYQQCGFRFTGLIEHFYVTREDGLLLTRTL